MGSTPRASQKACPFVLGRWLETADSFDYNPIPRVDGQNGPGVLEEEEEEEEEFIASGNWRGKHNSLSRGVGADQP